MSDATWDEMWFGNPEEDDAGRCAPSVRDLTDYLREVVDRNDLRALGYCYDCGQPITLRQIGRCVYSDPCDHYRAQGDLSRVRAAHERSRAKLTLERTRSLLALIGR